MYVLGRVLGGPCSLAINCPLPGDIRKNWNDTEKISIQYAKFSATEIEGIWRLEELSRPYSNTSLHQTNGDKDPLIIGQSQDPGSKG